MNHAFWIVWSPTGTYPPRAMHPEEETAVREAQRLARGKHGHAFYVLQARSVSRKVDVETTRLPAECPF